MKREDYRGSWSGPGYSADPFHRLYIRYRGKRVACLSSFGKGIIEEDGLDLFEWLREGRNIERLKKGILHICSEDPSLRTIPINYVNVDAEMVVERKQMGLRNVRREATYPLANLLDQFTHARVSEKLEWIASPQADLQARLPLLSLETPNLHGPRWCYLLDLDTDTLDVYEPRCALVPETGSPPLEPASLIKGDTPAYYCKIHLSELQAMWRKDWVTRHRAHAEALARLWTERATQCPLNSCGKTMSFKRLYDITFNDKPAYGARRRYPRRSTRANLGGIASKSTQPTSCGSRKAAHSSTFLRDGGVQGGSITKASNSRRSSRLVDLSRARRAACRGAAHN